MYLEILYLSYLEKYVFIMWLVIILFVAIKYLSRNNVTVNYDLAM